MAEENDQNTENTADVQAETSLPTLAEWEEAKKKIEETKDLYLRTKADMENVRRRAQIDLDNAYKYSVEKFAKELVGVVDSLEHGIGIANTEYDNAMREGMSLTLKLLLDIFEKFGIKCIEPVIGDEFNPKIHEALSMQHSIDVEPNKIMLVAQKGFTLQERLLRPARVIIAKAPVEAS